MGYLNDSFQEEFKSLDKLCREIYRSEKGVTSYINDMKCVSGYQSRLIPKWDADLRKLMDLRDLRNRLAHETGTLYDDLCTENDIEWLENFHSRILERSDPMALVHQNRKARVQAPRPAPPPQVETVSFHWSPPPRPDYKGAIAIVAVIGVLILAVLGVVLYAVING